MRRIAVNPKVFRFTFRIFMENQLVWPIQPYLEKKKCLKKLSLQLKIEALTFQSA
jgi:hypothetical protein